MTARDAGRETSVTVCGPGLLARGDYISVYPLCGGQQSLRVVRVATNVLTTRHVWGNPMAERCIAWLEDRIIWPFADGWHWLCSAALRAAREGGQ